MAQLGGTLGVLEGSWVVLGFPKLEVASGELLSPGASNQHFGRQGT